MTAFPQPEAHDTVSADAGRVEHRDAESMGRSHVRGSALLLVGRVLSMVFTILTQVLVVRSLSRSEYGAFAYALVIVSAGRTLLSLGQGKLLSRFMSTYEEQRDYARMFGSMALAVLTIVATSIVLLLGLYLFAEDLGAAAIDDPQAVQVLLILMFLAPMEALDQVFVSLFAVFTRARAIFFRKYLLTPGLRLLVVLFLVVLDADVVFLAIGYVVTQLLGLFIYAPLLVRALRERGLMQHFRVRRMVLPFKSVFSFSIPTMTSELVYLSMHTGSVILLGMHGGTVAVAGYRAVFPAARLNQFVWQTFVTLFLPMSARLYERGDHSGLRRTYWSTALFLAVLTFPVFAMTTIFADVTTVTLFGERYADSAAVMLLLSVGYYFNVAVGFNAYTLQVYGRLRYLVVVNVAAAAFNLALCAVLVPGFGATGVAGANCITMVLQNVANQVALARSMGGGFIGRSYLSSYGLLALALAVLGVVRAGIDPGFVVAGIATGAVWVLTLLLLRRRLQLAQTFPELVKVPVLGRLLR
jgi:O-antigen/teichoic acid export membrane protein